jgi:PucR C-terminal helix-turn-helix domain
LRARQGEIEEAVYARVRDAVPDPVGLADAEYVAGLRATVGAVVRYGLEGIERGEEITEPIPSVALAQAHRAARNGVPLDTVLLRYTAGYTLLEDFVIEEFERCDCLGENGALRHLLKVQAALLERLTTAIAGEYKYERERTSRSPEQRRSELVRRLLSGAPVDTAAFDYDFSAWHLGVIATGPGAVPALRSLQVGLGCELLSVPRGGESVWAWLGGRRRLTAIDLERAGRVLDAHTRRLGDLGGGPGWPLPKGLYFACGEPASGLEGWRLTHRQAQAALVVALRRRDRIPRNGSPPTLTRYADVALLAAALQDEALARALIDVYLSPLGDPHNGNSVLCETLRAYLAAECHSSSAAAKLDLARGTVAKRLRMIEEKLGRTLHPCPAELEVALLLDELEV